MGTGACVALKSEIGLKFLVKSLSSATCWGGWCDDVRADFPGHLLQRSKLLQITWFEKFDTQRKVYLFIYQVKLCDEVVEVLVAGVHVRFRTWQSLILRCCYLGSKESKAPVADLIKLNQVNTY